MIVKLINEPNALHLVKAKFVDEFGEHPLETKFGHLAYMVRNCLVNEYGISESRINSFKLENSFQKFGENANSKIKANYDFSDLFKLEKKCYDATVRNIKSNSFANQISKEERKTVRIVIKAIFDQYGVIESV